MVVCPLFSEVRCLLSQTHFPETCSHGPPPMLPPHVAGYLLKCRPPPPHNHWQCWPEAPYTSSLDSGLDHLISSKGNYLSVPGTSQGWPGHSHHHISLYWCSDPCKGLQGWPPAPRPPLCRPVFLRAKGSASGAFTSSPWTSTGTYSRLWHSEI